jgi:hypothetical protein
MYLHDVLVYQERAAHTKGVFRFEKVAYPDLVGARGCPYGVMSNTLWNKINNISFEKSRHTLSQVSQLILSDLLRY